MKLRSIPILAVVLMILSFDPIFCYSQKVTFREVKLKPNSRLFDTKDSTIIYPIVVARHAAISDGINKELRRAVVDEFNDDESDSTLTVKEALRKQTANRLIHLSYEVLYNARYILSLKVSAEGCGAYCDTYHQFFNFDLKTGRPLMITDVIAPNKLDAFKKLVAKDKMKYLNAYKKEAGNEDFLGYVNSNCLNVVSIESFTLTPKFIEIHDPCEFPHAIQSQEPGYRLQYPLKKINKYLNPDIRSQLLK